MEENVYTQYSWWYLPLNMDEVYLIRFSIFGLIVLFSYFFYGHTVHCIWSDQRNSCHTPAWFNCPYSLLSIPTCFYLMDTMDVIVGCCFIFRDHKKNNAHKKNTIIAVQQYGFKWLRGKIVSTCSSKSCNKWQAYNERFEIFLNFLQGVL